METEYPLAPENMGPVPIGDEDGWVTNADYPLDAWRNGEEGTVIYELAVDSAGMVTGCVADNGSATATLKAETCRLLRQRAQFEPMRDYEGNPVASTFSGFVSWEREPELGSGSFTIKVAFTIDERGAISNCRIIERSGKIAAKMAKSLERNPCPGSSTGVPVRDAQGLPVARDVVLTLMVESVPAATSTASSDQ
jgi:protein TonB